MAARKVAPTLLPARATMPFPARSIAWAPAARLWLVEYTDGHRLEVAAMLVDALALELHASSEWDDPFARKCRAVRVWASLYRSFGHPVLPPAPVKKPRRGRRQPPIEVHETHRNPFVIPLRQRTLARAIAEERAS